MIQDYIGKRKQGWEICVTPNKQKLYSPYVFIFINLYIKIYILFFLNYLLEFQTL